METTKQKFEPKHYSVISDIWYFIRYYRKHEPMVLVCCAAEILLGALLPLLLIYLPKLALDLVEQKAGVGYAVRMLGSYSLLMMLLYGLYQSIQMGKYMLFNTQRTNLIGMLFLKSLRIRYADVESGEIKKVYWKAYDSMQGGDWSASSRMVCETVNLFVNLLSFLLYSTVVGYLSVPMLVILLALSFINYGISMCHIRFQESLREESALAQKHFYCVVGAMGNVKGAKDIRIYGMKNWMLRWRDLVVGELRKIAEKSKKKDTFYEKTGFVMAAGRNLGAYVYLLYQTYHGSVSVGEFMLYFGAITGFSEFVNSMMGSLATLRDAANGTDYIRTYLELPEENRTDGSRHIEELTLPLEIAFQNVSFAYRDSSEDAGEDGAAEEETGHDGLQEKGKAVFKNLNLTIHAGEKLALVGVNGAGKTTLVKLLCGMYEPDGGQILINGIDRNEFPKEELYRLFSVVFQEPLILPFTIGENLAMDRVGRVEEQRAWDALDRAGLKDVFLEKKIDLQSYMTKDMMEDGVELSGGQQQRFLLARALYKDAPIMILDEPTAALDPIAESEVYDHYNQYSQGKTAVFISHRLASTKFSDRIVLLEDGRILETGTHAELMQAGKAYARMFEIQSSYYTEDTDKMNDACSGVK